MAVMAWQRSCSTQPPPDPASQPAIEGPVRGSQGASRAVQSLFVLSHHRLPPDTLFRAAAVPVECEVQSECWVWSCPRQRDGWPPRPVVGWMFLPGAADMRIVRWGHGFYAARLIITLVRA